jgi:type I restriction enzyme M protein
MDEDISKIVGAYHAWRGDKGAAKYTDVAGFCKGSNLGEITKHGYVLTPGRYVGAEDVADDGEPYEVKMPRLAAELSAQFAESVKLERLIKANLKGLGYGD